LLGVVFGVLLVRAQPYRPDLHREPPPHKD
jgi:hypothetical protein